MSVSNNANNGVCTTGKLVLLRHGQTVWSQSGQYTGRTDIPLTDVGREQAVSAGERLRKAFPEGFKPQNIHVSTLCRAQETANLAGFAEHQNVTSILEWDYGRAEGRTRQQIAQLVGGAWDVWRDGSLAIDVQYGGDRIEVMPDGTEFVVHNGEGELLEMAAARTRDAIDQVMPALEAGDNVLMVAHAHILRILTSQWVGADPVFARHLKLDTARYAVLSLYKGDRVIEHWNL